MKGFNPESIYADFNLRVELECDIYDIAKHSINDIKRKITLLNKERNQEWLYDTLFNAALFCQSKWNLIADLFSFVGKPNSHAICS